MAAQSVTQLASELPNNLRYLSTLIARKPQERSTDWAATADEAFSLYTRTNTVNVMVLWNNALAELGWAFPSYLNLREIIGSLHIRRGGFLGLGKKRMRLPEELVAVAASPSNPAHVQLVSEMMTGLFKKNSHAVFTFWENHELLKAKKPILESIRKTYKGHLFPACMPTILGLLDFVMRDYFQTDSLNVSLQTLSNAFDKAGILPKHLKPGLGLWDLAFNKKEENLLFSVERDLRLPGVLLSSFVEFAGSYYGWYSVVDPSRQAPLNRHAIMHCADDYWSLHNTTKLLSFFDLTLRLERVLKIVIHGSRVHEGQTGSEG